MITWWTMLALAAGVYAQRLAGMFLIDTDRMSPRWRAVVGSIPLAIIAAVVALQTFSSDGQLTIDARMVGVGLGAVCAWRRLPLAVVVIVAAATTATIRALSG